jgi:hypothetical protein
MAKNFDSVTMAVGYPDPTYPRWSSSIILQKRIQGRPLRLAGRRGKIWSGRVLAYITGTVDQELLLRNEYLAAENRILKGQLKGRPTLSNG